MNKAWVVIANTLIALLLGFAVFIIVQYKFSIYQKKHGEQMTFTDFIFDAERK